MGGLLGMLLGMLFMWLVILLAVYFLVFFILRYFNRVAAQIWLVTAGLFLSPVVLYFLIIVAPILWPFWGPPTPSQEHRAQFSAPTPAQSLGRPFKISVFQIGDVPVTLPSDWVEPQYNVRARPTNWTKDTLIGIHPGEQAYINTTNVDLRLPPRSAHFELPPLHSFIVGRTADGAAEKNLRSQKTELDKRWPDRVVDEDGFWLWKTHEYVLTKSSYPRPFDQPLVVECSPTVGPNKGQLDCTVGLYWASNVFVRYDFTDREFPKSRWAELDQRVLALLDFLDGRKPGHAGN